METAIVDQLTATPVWLDRFMCQYQLADTTTCPEAIMNANRSLRWNQSATTGGMDRYSRDSDQLAFIEQSPPVEHEPLLAFAQQCMDHYTKERKQAAEVPRFGMGEGYNVLRYKPGEAYHAVHSDWGWPHSATRFLTFGMFLNTVPEGGELEFPDLEVKVAPVEGRAVIFPAAWMYAHRTLPAKMDRYVLNIFYGFLPEPTA